jgi:hypothetical protein
VDDFLRLNLLPISLTSTGSLPLKTYNKANRPSNPDHLEKAIALIEQDKMMKANNGTFRVVESQTLNVESCMFLLASRDL